MKKCPQCNTVYTDEVIYCLNDGTALVEENFSLPSTMTDLGEEETVIRHDPIVINIPENGPPDEPVTYQIPPNTENVIINPPQKKASQVPKYALFLIIGLIIGGGLVLAAILLSKGLFQNTNDNANRTTANANTKQAKVTNTNTADNRHLESNKIVNENELNGRVIAVNAYVRSAPGKDSATIDTLPMHDRLKIGDRENENSPWYQVTCEHGTSGWMHGNTIEFNK